VDQKFTPLRFVIFISLQILASKLADFPENKNAPPKRRGIFDH